MKSAKKRKINYKAKLWKVLSQVIRLRYANDDGYTQCITCGSWKYWKDLDAGHYIPKSLGLSIYFEEKNIAPQCTGCNRFRHGNQTIFALVLKRKYGDGILEELDAKRRKPIKIRDWEYQEMIKKYQKELKELMERHVEMNNEEGKNDNK